MARNQRHQLAGLDAFAALIDQFSEPDDFAAASAAGGYRFNLGDSMDRIADIYGSEKLPFADFH